MKPLLRSAVIMSGAISGAAPRTRVLLFVVPTRLGVLHSKFGPGEVVAAATDARKIDILFTIFRKPCYCACYRRSRQRGPANEGLLLALFD